MFWNSVTSFILASYANALGLDGDPALFFGIANTLRIPGQFIMRQSATGDLSSLPNQTQSTCPLASRIAARIHSIGGAPAR